MVLDSQETDPMQQDKPTEKERPPSGGARGLTAPVAVGAVPHPPGAAAVTPPGGAAVQATDDQNPPEGGRGRSGTRSPRGARPGRGRSSGDASARAGSTEPGSKGAKKKLYGAGKSKHGPAGDVSGGPCSPSRSDLDSVARLLGGPRPSRSAASPAGSKPDSSVARLLGGPRSAASKGLVRKAGKAGSRARTAAGGAGAGRAQPGVSAPSSGSRDKAPMQAACGAAAPASCAASTRGDFLEPSGPEGFDGDVTSLYRCPNCGWAPSRTDRAVPVRQARKHWRECVGKDPPTVNFTSLRSAIGKRFAPSRVANHKARALQKWLADRASWPAEARAAACDPALDAPFFRQGPHHGHTEFQCSKCSRRAGFFTFRRMPCKTAKKITAKRFCELTGQPYHDKLDRNRKMQAYRAARVRRRPAASS